MADPRHPHDAAVEPAPDSSVVGEAPFTSPFTSPTVDPTQRLSVLMVGQRSLAAQRRGRYVAGSGPHPAWMAPDLASALIADYTARGDWVLDPLAGIGTTHVEAIHLGRHAFGVETDSSWVALVRANIALARRQGGVTTPLAEPRTFKVVAWGEQAAGGGDAAADRKALLEFQEKVGRLEKAVSGAVSVAGETATRLEQIRRALDHAPGVDTKWQQTVRSLEKQNRDVLRALRGDVALRARHENTPVSISERVDYIVETQRMALAKPTGTQREAYQIASEEFAQELTKLRKLVDVDVKELEKALEAAGAPVTPGRLPEWRER